MANVVYTIARSRKIPFCALGHDLVTFPDLMGNPNTVLKNPSGLDVLWRQDSAWLWLNTVFAATRGGVS